MFWKNIKSFFAACLDLLAPRCCPGCDVEHPAGFDGFCEVCEPLLERLNSKQDKAPAINAALILYGGPLAEGIKSFKYKSRTDYAKALRSLLCEQVHTYQPLVDIVVPVPLHARRLRQRGYNQCALLARAVARSIKKPLRCGVLLRVRDTVPQVGLGGLARISNVQGAFRATNDVKGLRILLIDDVRSTGATLSESAGALRAQGAKKVYTLVLARGD
ncbi:MAG: ComF family protein [Myxococcales bacterium]|nr:MAG: ComF family protein [Myxococcales bacterium]